MENCLDFLWTSFTAFFGGKPSTTKIDSKQSYRSIIFISLLPGLIIFIFYKGYLSAELSVRIKKFPFTDLKSLSKTDWRYIFYKIILVHGNFSLREMGEAKNFRGGCEF